MTDTTLIERAKEALEEATPGRRVQFNPKYCPEAVGAPFHEFDNSHETSLILPDGTRYRRYSHHRHADDAVLDNMAPDLARALIREREAAERLAKACESAFYDVDATGPQEFYLALSAYREAQEETDNDK